MAHEYVLKTAPAAPDLRIDYAGELNPQQLAAVQAGDGPCLVLAGAGAGKTRTLTYRVAWLIENGIAPRNILLLTFTNKAAREMMQRVGDLLGGDPGNLWGGTFHSVGVRVLRHFADRVGYRPDFTIADREDAKDLLAAAITDAGIDPKESRFPKPEVLADIFSMAINTGREVAELVHADYESFGPIVGSILEVRRHFTERKRSAGMMDFDDLLVLWLRLLREDREVREALQRRFKYVLVDEYQDTNTLQGELIDALAAHHRNIMAVGDDAQSIYSWRGANFANILNFPKRYPGAAVYKIETNYRSTPEILSLANAVIASNTRQFAKELQPARKSGMRPAVIPCGDSGEQASFISQRVLELRDEGRRLDDICVLYRSHFHALDLQLELTRRNIPFTITSGIRFFEQAHIKDIAAYLKFVSHPQDELSFKRLCKMLPGIGNKGADKLWHALQPLMPPAAPLSPPTAAPVADDPGIDPNGDPAALLDGTGEAPPPTDTHTFDVAPLLTRIQDKVPRKTAAPWAQFTATISQLEAPDIRNAPSRMIRLALEADYEAYLESNYENPRSRLDDLEQLANYAQQFTSNAEFLSQLALQTNLEAEEKANRDNDDEERLRLSTVHQAKGLEFGAVFVIMLCDGLFPSERSADSLDGEEEERRLFYVAVTRAKDELYLCHPLVRFTAGGGSTITSPSRFLQEVDGDLVEEWHLRPQHRSAPPRSGGKGDGPYADEEFPEDEPF